MNPTCKKLLVLSSLLFSTFLFANQALALSAPGTTEEPTVLFCSTCSSNFDFTNYAKFNTPNNTAGYYLIANVDSQIVKQVYSWKAWEPELGLILGKAYLVTLLPEHQLSFDKHLTWVDNGSQLQTVDIDAEDSHNAPGWGQQPLAVSYNGIEITSYQSFGRYVYFNSTGVFGNRKNVVFKIKFKNGDVAYVYSPSGGTKPPILILALDKEGNIIGSPSIGSTGGTPTGASPFWSTTISPDKELSCSWDEPVVTCTVAPPEGED